MEASPSEMFGPVATETVYRFESAQDVIEQVNNAEYGLRILTISHSPGVWPMLLKVSWLVKATKLL